MPLSLLSVASAPIENGEGFVFVILPSKKSQSPIIFGMVQLRMSAITNSGSDSELPQFFHYARLAHHMMRKMGYNLQRGNGLNFERGQHGLLLTFVPTGKPTNYYYKTHREFGYVTSPALFQSEEDKYLPSHLSISSKWESDVSMGVLFKNLFVNMTSINQLEHEEAIEMFESESWAQQLDLQWEKRFEQRKSPTEDRVIQVDVGSRDHPKPISISESLSLTERKELITLIRKYIDVFEWNYEDMTGLDPQIAMHRLNIKPDVKPVKQQQRRFCPDIMKAIEAEIHKLIECSFIREEQYSD